jgi:hypothetical protein
MQFSLSHVQMSIFLERFTNYRDHSRSVSGDCSSIDQVLSDLVVRQDCPGLTPGTWRDEHMEYINTSALNGHGCYPNLSLYVYEYDLARNPMSRFHSHFEVLPRHEERVLQVHWSL